MKTFNRRTSILCAFARRFEINRVLFVAVAAGAIWFFVGRRILT